MKTKKYDAIIIGGSIAGSFTAYNLAKKDIKVLVLEKMKFPRIKPCAGGITNKCFDLFDFSIEEEVKNEAKDIVATYKNEFKFEGNVDRPIVKAIERKDFDFFLIKKAVEKGVEFLDGINIKNIIKNEIGFIVELDDNIKFECAYLVGADGTNGIVNKIFNIVDPSNFGFAIEVNCPVDKKSINNYKMTYDFGNVPNGYAWIFPKDEHLSLGIFITDQKNKDIIDYLNNYINYLGLNYNEKIRGHKIPFYGINYKQPSYPCILVGDAAGFGNYLTGEGIYYALKSGIITADIIKSSIDEGTFKYKELQKRYNKEIIHNLKISYYTGKIVYKYESIVFNKYISKILFLSLYIFY